MSSIIFLTREIGFFIFFKPRALPMFPFPSIIDASNSCFSSSLKTDPFLIIINIVNTIINISYIINIIIIFKKNDQ